jgi:hypothetical protein
MRGRAADQKEKKEQKEGKKDIGGIIAGSYLQPTISR